MYGIILTANLKIFSTLFVLDPTCQALKNAACVQVVWLAFGLDCCTDMSHSTPAVTQHILTY